MPPATPAPSPAAVEAWRLMGQIVQTHRGSFVAACTEVALSPPQAMALRSLQPEAPMPMSALAGLMHCDNSNVTGIVDRLEARGLVAREPGVQDRRVKYLRVTVAGAAVRTQLDALLDHPPERLLALTAGEQRQLAALLRKVTG